MDECREYTGTIASNGYGVKKVDGKMLKAHRIVMAEIHGWEALEGKVVMHLCDNPPCINPDHLRIGTLGDNWRDMVEKRRHWNNRKTHCDHGHEFTDENTYTHNGQRHCRACRASRSRELRRKRAMSDG